MNLRREGAADVTNRPRGVSKRTVVNKHSFGRNAGIAKEAGVKFDAFPKREKTDEEQNGVELRQNSHMREDKTLKFANVCSCFYR